MSDFFSLTVTVRAPRPSFSRRACACSPIGPAASRSWSRVVRSSGKVDSALICLAGAFSATGRSSMPRASWCSAGPTVGPRMLAASASDNAAKRADGFDAEPVQLLLGDRADAPQPPHRKALQQYAFLVATHHADAVGLGQARGDLGDLLSGSGADGGDQPGLVADFGPQVLAECLDSLGRRPGELGRFAEGFVEGELFKDGHDASDGVEHSAAGHAVHHAARGQHHGRGADQAAGLMHGHRRPRAVHACLVAGAGDHAAPAKAADQHGPTAQRRPGQLLDGRVERVHVEVQHPAVHNCRCYGASLTAMTQQAPDVGEFSLWVEHFERNGPTNACADAAIDFDGPCHIPEAVRRPLIESVRRFQLGESGDGEQLLRKAQRAGDPEYLRAAQLFVAEEQQHAALLLRLLGHLGGTPMRRHWSDAVFVRLRRLHGPADRVDGADGCRGGGAVVLRWTGRRRPRSCACVLSPPASSPTNIPMCGFSVIDCVPASRSQALRCGCWPSRSGG